MRTEFDRDDLAYLALQGACLASEFVARNPTGTAGWPRSAAIFEDLNADVTGRLYCAHFVYP
jgi:hypothetical protein